MRALQDAEGVPIMRNALVADVSHTLIMTYHNNANQPCAVAWTLLNMYVTVSLLFNSCHLNATEIVSVIAVKFEDVEKIWPLIV